MSSAASNESAQDAARAQQSARHKAADAAPAADTIINERYRIVDRLGQGGMGQVLLAEDLWMRRNVALKKLRKDVMDRNQVANLRSEFLTVAHLAHPHLVPPYDFGRDWNDGEFFFTSEFVDGRHINVSLGAYDTGSFCEALAQSCRALDFLHNHGLVHGDIKPENMLLQMRPGDAGALKAGRFRVRLIDFGLTVTERGFIGKKIVGTAYYIAPEAILGSMLDRRTDLYSLGVVFYRLATGQLPFQGKSNIEILKGHIEHTPPMPHELNPQVPLPVSKLIMRLMAKKPAARFSTAAEVLAALPEAAGRPIPIETPATAEAYLRSNPLVGRAHEMHILQTLLMRGLDLAGDRIGTAGAAAPIQAVKLPVGRFAIVLLEGAEGLGKARLFRELRLFAQIGGAQVFTLGPENAVSNLAAQLRTDNQDAAVIERLVELSRKQPVLLLYHDFEAAHESCAAFVRAVTAKTAAAPYHSRILTCLSASLDHRSQALSQLLMLQDVKRQLAAVRLEPLSHNEMRELIDLTFPEHRFPASFCDQVVRESEGSPGAALAILNALVTEEKLLHGPEGWAPTFASLGDVVLPSTGRRHIEEKIHALEPVARRLAEDLSILTGPFTVEAVRTIATTPPARILGALTELKRRGILIADNERFRFATRSTREILYGALPEAPRRTLHNKAAVFLAAAKAPATELFPHILFTDRNDEALRCGLQAAAALHAASQEEQALDVLARIKQIPEWAAQGPEAEFLLAEVLAALGRNREAEESLNTLAARPDAGGPLRRDTLAMLAMVRLKLGRPVEAGKAADEALRAAKEAGRSAVMTQLTHTVAQLLYARGDYRQSAAATARTLAAARDTQDDPHVWRLMLLHAESLMRLGKPQEAIVAVSRALERIGNSQSPGQMTASLRCLAAFWRYRNHASKSISQLQICRAACQRLQLKDDEIECLVELAAMHAACGDATVARRYALQAQKEIESTGNRVFLLDAQLILAESAWALGYHEEARTNGGAALALSKEFENPVAHLRARTILARVVSDQGAIPAAEKLLADAAGQSQYEETTRSLRLAQAHVACLLGQWHKVWELLETPYAKGDVFHPEATLFLALAAVARGKTEALAMLRTGLASTAKREDFALVDAMLALLDGLMALAAGRDNHGFARFNDALRLSRSARSDRLVTWISLFAGRALAREQQYEQAYLTFKEGLFMAKRRNLVLLKGYFWYEMGLLELAISAGDLDRAAQHLAAAEATARKHGLKEILALVSTALARTETKLGLFADAQAHLKAGIEMLTSALTAVNGTPDDGTLLAIELKAAREAQHRLESILSQAHTAVPQGFFGLLGRSATIQEVFHAITALTPKERWICIEGPQGSGKTATARAMHRHFRAPEERLRWAQCLDLNSSAGAELLAALAGDVADTLVLEEISNLSLEAQQTLCRALPAAVGRIIITTCYAMEELFDTGVLDRGLFPEKMPVLRIPPLSARTEDIDLLATHFLRARKPDNFAGTIRLSGEARTVLQEYVWPRNVQELCEFCTAAYTHIRAGMEIPAQLARLLLAPTKSVPAN